MTKAMGIELLCALAIGCGDVGAIASSDAGAALLPERMQHPAGGDRDGAPPADVLGQLADVAAEAPAASVDVAPALDLGEPPINVVAPLPAATLAWLDTVPECVAITIRGYGRDAGVDRCEGRTRNGVRCVECFDRVTGTPLSAECESTGGCASGEGTPLVCVADCFASCERQPRYCPPVVSP
ncbi:MAG TPA: hypothetical protein VN646_16815 [Candidatus Acidoferrum sp.]|nr:hypothetical protein [Candidatus Acidoferrum sp.]